jgi:hypothetical protein
MSGLAFDSLAYARRLEAAGFTREQAEALAAEQAKLLDERLATKTDLEQTRAMLSRDIEDTRASLSRDIEALRLSAKADLAETRADILKWVVGTIGLQTVVILGAVIALARVLPH